MAASFCFFALRINQPDNAKMPANAAQIAPMMAQAASGV